jgi:hypothetical protein
MLARVFGGEPGLLPRQRVPVPAPSAMWSRRARSPAGYRDAGGGGRGRPAGLRQGGERRERQRREANPSDLVEHRISSKLVRTKANQGRDRKAELARPRRPAVIGPTSRMVARNGPRRARLPRLLGQPHLDQRLIGHVACRRSCVHSQRPNRTRQCAPNQSFAYMTAPNLLQRLSRGRKRTPPCETLGTRRRLGVTPDRK